MRTSAEGAICDRRHMPVCPAFGSAARRPDREGNREGATAVAPPLERKLGVTAVVTPAEKVLESPTESLVVEHLFD